MKEKNVKLNGKTVLITGAAGFIGSHLAVRLLDSFEDIKVVGYDNVNDYYDVRLKEERLENLSKYENFIFVKGDIADKAAVDAVFAQYKPAVVVNLAAQAGVRYSIENPGAYIEANVIGFYNILEACRHSDPKVEHLVYASSSSVYGGNTKLPFSTKDQVDHPLSLYAATKKSNELFAYSYSNLYGMATTGLRFFTVYGPMGRPDMALFLFADKLLKGDTIQIFNYGNCRRDFTYVDDIVTGVVDVMQSTPDEDEKGNRYKVYNIGNHNPENLMDFVDILQKELVAHGCLPEDFDFEAHRELLPMQPGDVEATFADVDDLMNDFDFKPDMPLKEGIHRFVDWYAGYVKRRDNI